MRDFQNLVEIIFCSRRGDITKSTNMYYILDEYILISSQEILSIKLFIKKLNLKDKIRIKIINVAVVYSSSLL